jgi:hypothetical protein
MYPKYNNNMIIYIQFSVDVNKLCVFYQHKEHETVG